MPDPDEARAVVERDLRIGLEDVLPDEGVGGFQPLAGFEDTRPIADFNRDGRASVVAVPWQWTGVQLAPLLGMPATVPPRVLTIRGVTLVQDSDEHDEGLLLHRYIDWAATIEELGTHACHRPITDVRNVAGEQFLDVEQFQRLVEEGLI